MPRRLSAAAGALAILATLLPPGMSVAAPPPDDPGWIRQGGNGAAGSSPIGGMALTEVLYSPSRFKVAGTPAPLHYDRWRGWGAIEHPSGAVQLAMAHGGMDATYWSDPQPAWLRDPDGNDVPFLLGDSVHFGVGFQNTRSDWPAYFIVYWNGGDPRAIGSNVDGSPGITGTHMAFSYDGVAWFDDQIIANHTTAPVITGSAGFNSGMLGASQVLLDPNKPACTASPSASFPFDCPITIVYTAIDASGKTSIAAAGADGYDLVATRFRGRASPLLSAGGTTWDNGSVDLAKTRKRTEPFGTGFEMTYAGTLSNGGCRGTAVCSIGVASSNDRITWTKNNAARAATEPKIYETYVGPATLGPATFAFDQNPEGHARGFIAVRDSSGDGSTWLGLTHPKPKTAPTLEVSKPDNGFYNKSSLTIDLFANDDRGPNPGIDLSSITLEVDGKPVHEMKVSWSWGPTIIGSFHYLGVRITAPEAHIGLADGEHWLEAHVLDLDGEHAQLITKFTIDTKLPASSITTATPSGPLAPVAGSTPPLGNAIHVEGSTSDNLSGVQRMYAVVTNQLGEHATFDSTVPGSGFNVTMLSPTEAVWTWDAPVNHPVLMVPGYMRFSFLGRDKAGNVELAGNGNTVTQLVI